MSYGRNGEGYQSSSGFGSMGYGYQGGTSFADPTSVMQNWGASSRSAGGGKGLVDSYVADKTSALTKTAQAGAFTALGAGALAGGSSIASVGSTVAGAIGISAGASSAILGVGALALAGGATAVGLKLAGPTIIKGGTSSLKWSVNKIKTKIISGKSKNDEFDKESSKAINETNASYDENAVTKSTKLDEKSEQIAKREEKFNSLVDKQRDNLKEGKGEDARSSLKQMYDLKLPSKTAKNSLHKLTADYIIKSSAVGKIGEDGIKMRLSQTEVKKNINSFVKEAKLCFSQKREIIKAVADRVEAHKDDLDLDKNNKFVSLEKNRGTAKETAKANKEKVEKIKADKTNESKAQKKTTPSKAPTKANNLGKEQGR